MYKKQFSARPPKQGTRPRRPAPLTLLGTPYCPQGPRCPHSPPATTITALPPKGIHSTHTQLPQPQNGPFLAFGPQARGPVCAREPVPGQPSPGHIPAPCIRSHEGCCLLRHTHCPPRLGTGSRSAQPTGPAWCACRMAAPQLEKQVGLLAISSQTPPPARCKDSFLLLRGVQPGQRATKAAGPRHAEAPAYSCRAGPHEDTHSESSRVRVWPSRGGLRGHALQGLTQHPHLTPIATEGAHPGILELGPDWADRGEGCRDRSGWGAQPDQEIPSQGHILAGPQHTQALGGTWGQQEPNLSRAPASHQLGGQK